MEGVSTTAYKGLRGYWRRRGYERLNGSGRRRRNRVELGSNNRRRFWRVKIVPKFRTLFKRASPKGFFIWLRDAYVNMMLSFANSRSITAGYGGGGFGNGLAAFGKRPMKEYDEKMIVEIYKSILMAHGQLMPREAVRIGS